MVQEYTLDELMAIGMDEVNANGPRKQQAQPAQREYTFEELQGGMQQPPAAPASTYGQELQQGIETTQRMEQSVPGKIIRTLSAPARATTRFLTGVKDLTPSQELEFRKQVYDDAIKTGSSEDAARKLAEGDSWKRLAKDAVKTAAAAGTMIVPFGKGVPGVVRSVGTTAGIFGGAKLAEDVIDGKSPEEMKSDVTGTAIGTAAIDLGVRGVMKVAPAVARSILDPIIKNVPLKLSKNSFVQAADQYFGASKELAENFYDNPKKIANFGGTVKANPAYLESVAKKLKSAIATKKGLYGARIDRQLKRIGQDAVDINDVIRNFDDAASDLTADTLQTGRLDVHDSTLIENLRDDLYNAKGYMTVQEIDNLRKAINSKLYDKAKPPTDRVSMLLKNVRQQLTDQINDPEYKAALAAYTKLGDSVEVALGGDIFEYAGMPTGKETGNKVANAIRKRLMRVGRLTGAEPAFTENEKMAINNLEKVLSKSNRVYQDVLDHNTYKTFIDTVRRQNPSKFGIFGDFQRTALKESTGLTKAAEGIRKRLPLAPGQKERVGEGVRRGITTSLSELYSFGGQ